MLDVAQEFGVRVVDARPLLDADPERFIDMCHPDEIGHASIAALMLEAVREVAPALGRPGEFNEYLAHRGALP